MFHFLRLCLNVKSEVSCGVFKICVLKCFGDMYFEVVCSWSLQTCTLEFCFVMDFCEFYKYVKDKYVQLRKIRVH